MDIVEYIKTTSNSDLVELIKDLKNSEKYKEDVFKFSKNFRFLLNLYREYTNISLLSFIEILEENIQEEIFERISKNKIIIY